MRWLQLIGKAYLLGWCLPQCALILGTYEGKPRGIDKVHGQKGMKSIDYWRQTTKDQVRYNTEKGSA